jgi:rhodanese-related sulfurtransferase
MQVMVLASSFNQGIWILNGFLLLIVLYMIGSPTYYWWRGRQLKGALTEEEFEKGRTRAQIIDLRERKTFDTKHILGARSMPMASLKQDMGSLRKDLPVYVYESGTNLAIRAALQLKKAGFTEVRWLKGGFREWHGKTKGKAAA